MTKVASVPFVVPMLQLLPLPQPEKCIDLTYPPRPHTEGRPFDVGAADTGSAFAMGEWAKHGLGVVAGDETVVLEAMSRSLQHLVVTLGSHLAYVGVGRTAVDVVEDIPSWMR